MTMIRTGEDMLSVAVLAQTRIGPVLIMPGHGHKPHFLQCQWCGQWGVTFQCQMCGHADPPKGWRWVRHTEGYKAWHECCLVCKHCIFSSWRDFFKLEPPEHFDVAAYNRFVIANAPFSERNMSTGDHNDSHEEHVHADDPEL